MGQDRFSCVLLSLCLHLGIVALVLLWPLPEPKLADIKPPMTVRGFVTLGAAGKTVPGSKEMMPATGSAQEKPQAQKLPEGTAPDVQPEVQPLENAQAEAEVRPEVKPLDKQEETPLEKVDVQPPQDDAVKIAEEKAAAEKLEAEKLAAQKREEEKAAAEQAEAQRILAEQKRLAEEKKKADELKKAQEKKAAEDKKKAEEKRLAEEKKKADELKKAQEKKAAEEKRLAEEKKKAEDKKKADAKKKKDNVKDALAGLQSDVKKQDTKGATKKKTDGKGTKASQAMADLEKGLTDEEGGSGNDDHGTGPGGRGGDGVGQLGPYEHIIVQSVEPNWQVAPRADRNILDAEVLMVIEPDGSITSAQVVRSSGNRMFDSGLIRAITMTRVLDEPPPNGQRLTAQVTFVQPQ